MNTPTDTIVAINPTTWNAPFRFDHAQLRPAPSQVLSIAGQASVADDGTVAVNGSADRIFAH